MRWKRMRPTGRVSCWQAGGPRGEGCCNMISCRIRVFVCRGRRKYCNNCQSRRGEWWGGRAKGCEKAFWESIIAAHRAKDKCKTPCVYFVLFFFRFSVRYNIMRIIIRTHYDVYIHACNIIRCKCRPFTMIIKNVPSRAVAVIGIYTYIIIYIYLYIYARAQERNVYDFYRAVTGLARINKHLYILLCTQPTSMRP